MPQGLMLIAYDGSDNAKRAVDYAGRFLSANRAVLVTAWEPMVRQAARMSGLSGVMQPSGFPTTTSRTSRTPTPKSPSPRASHWPRPQA